MSSESVEIVRRSLERFIETGVPDWEATDPDVLVVDHDIMDGTEYRGLEGVQRWVSDWSSAWSGFAIDPERYAGECVVVIVRMKATGAASGIEIERQDGIVYRVRDAKVSRLDYFNSAEQAFRAAGLPC